MSFAVLILCGVAALVAGAEDAIVLPLEKAVWTITSEGKLSPGLVQWMSDKPATAKAEITIRFGVSIADLNIAARASVKASDAAALTNAKKSGQTYSEADVSQFVLTSIDPTVLLRDASRETAQIFSANTTYLHVEVSCPALSNPLSCTLNDDMKVDIDFKLADGICWFKNICSHIGTPQQTKCIDFGATGYECVCADGFASQAQPSGPPKCVAVTTVPGATTSLTLGPTKEGVPATTAGSLAAGESPASTAAARLTLGVAAFVIVVVAQLLQ